MNTEELVPATTTVVSTCHISAENFATLDECEKHVCMRHLCSVLTCPSCTQLFHTSEELDGHDCPCSRSSSLSLSHRCEECGLQFVSMRQLRDRAVACKGVGDNLCRCNGRGCRAKCSTSDDAHIETCCDNDSEQNDNQGKAVGDQESSVWQPDDSKTCLKSPTSFDCTLHTKKRTLKCSQCDHVFTHQASLSQHALFHTGVKPHLCGRCFEQPSQLRAHRKLVCSPNCIRLRFPIDDRRRRDAAKNRPRKSVRIADPEFTILQDDKEADTSLDSDVDTTFQTQRETENIRSDRNRSPHTSDDDDGLIVESNGHQPSAKSSTAPGRKVVSHSQKSSGRTACSLSHLRNDNKTPTVNTVNEVSQAVTRRGNRLHNKSATETNQRQKPITRTFHCKVCGETFAAEQFLASHHAKVHGGSAEKRLVCGQCGKQFSQQFLLQAHMAVHNGIQKCETCSKLFTTVDALQMHQRAHRRKTAPLKRDIRPAALADKTSRDGHVAVEILKETALTSTKNETEKIDLKRSRAVDDSDSDMEWNDKCSVGPIRTRLLEKRPAKSDAVKRLKIISVHPGKTELERSLQSALERLTASPDSPDVEDRGDGFESDEDGMSLKVDEQPDLRDFRCAECDKYFVSAEFLRAHAELHGVAPPGFGVRCTRCRERFDYLFEMHAHVAQQHWSRRADTATPAVLICIKCGVRAESVNQLLLHALTHTGEMPNRCTSCAHCFLSRLELEQHACVTADRDVLICRQKSHSSEQLLVSGSVVSCSSVTEPQPAVVTTPSGMSRTNRQPTDIANGLEAMAFECSECDKRFQFRFQLLAHETRHTSATQCSLCQKVFAKFHRLENHLRWHTGEMVHMCTVCDDASFRNSIQLWQHYAVVHKQNAAGNPTTTISAPATSPTLAPPVDSYVQVQCPACDRWFAGRSFLTAHIRLHVSGGVKPDDRFACVHCSQRFKFQYELQTHVSLLHADMKCILCHRRFSDEASLRVDALQHTGELPHSCDSCNKSFCSETLLQAHIDSSHLVVRTEALMEQLPPPDLSDTNQHGSDDDQEIERIELD